MTRLRPCPLLLAVTLFGCSPRGAREGADPDSTAAIAEWSDARLSDTEIDSARYEDSWRLAPSVDSLIVPDSVAGRHPGDSILIAGNAPTVLSVQILLDRSPFHPGVIDGHWGKNTEKAVFWLQHQEGLPATGQVDSLTFRRLLDLAGRPDSLFETVVLGPDDLAGPFEEIPEEVAQRAGLPCLCYESPSEKLAEKYHVTEAVLGELNPGVALDRLSPGDSLRVPAVVPLGAEEAAPPPRIARLIISDEGRFLHAVDSVGGILLHFPATLGSSFSPSPAGMLEVTRVSRDPWFHWQPKRLEGVDDSKAPVRLPPGPNSPVGLVWMQLSQEHYGIHGTNQPATIGYATSSGCVRLTNWDALFLATVVRRGTPVEFRDVRTAEQVADRAHRTPPGGRL